LFIARRDAYFAAGGHAGIRASLHDGLKLPRLFRRAGFGTDLFDATPIATCRMYHTNSEVWRGLSRNATEGLAAPGTLGPMTLLLGGGHVLPILLVLGPGLLSPGGKAQAGLAMVLSLIPRLLAALRFHQPLGSAVLHPLGVLVLLVIQWNARLRTARGQPSTWKGRSYDPSPNPSAGPGITDSGALSTSLPGTTTSRVWIAALAMWTAMAATVGAAAPPPTKPGGESLSSFELKDQFARSHAIQFPRTNLLVLTIADHKGSEQSHGWVEPLKQRYGTRIAMEGIADVSGVPGFLRGFVESKFRKHMSHGVMLDWTGAVVKPLACERGKVTVLVVDREGRVRGRAAGPASPQGLKVIFDALDASR
jgi:hypothetical protein